jgi:RNA-binding protein YhbY
MSVAESISNRIKHMPKGKPFAGAVFAQAGSRASVDKALSRMVLSGSLERVARGVYMRPKQSEYTGKKVRANPIAVMQAVVKARGETIQVHGVEAARRLGLSTQMQVLPTYYTSGSTREIKIGGAVVRLRHASRQRLQQAGTQVGIALTAVLYIGKEGLTEHAISKIASSLSAEEFNKFMACKMPQWMRSAFAGYVKEYVYQDRTSNYPQQVSPKF